MLKTNKFTNHLRTRIKPEKERNIYFFFLCDDIFFFLYKQIKKRFKMNIDELINKLQNTLNNKLINGNDLSIKTTNLLNELLETLKIIENCTSCKKGEKIDGKGLDKCLADLEKEEQGKKKEDIIYRLNRELNKIDFGLNKKASLCEDCKGKKVKKLTDKYGNEEMARLLYYQCKLNAKYYNSKYIRWIPFYEFKNIKYLAKGGFGEVHKATWIRSGYYNDDDEMKYKDIKVVLKRIYNNSSDDKIVDILKEVSLTFVVDIDIYYYHRI